MTTERQPKYKVGDKVKLNVGGPDMAVQAVYPKGIYRCQWFAGKKLDKGDFPEDSLITVQEKANNED